MRRLARVIPLRFRRPAWLGTVRRMTPISDVWGFDRGTPIDRYYIERFLERHRADISGAVLEVGDSRYTERFGTGVITSDVLDRTTDNDRATLVADLARPEDFPSDAYNCFILVQTLQYIYDVRAAVATAWRVLRPNGVLLLTVPSLSRVARSAGLENDFWRFTHASCRRLLHDQFGAADVEVAAYGNVLTAVGFLMGMASEELNARELAARDEWFPTLVTARAVKRV
jgi:SAM-dependent methyltransferase